MFFRRCSLFIIIAMFILNVVSASSGLSDFKSVRSVDIKIVNSENALIAMPETIVLDVEVLKEKINYYRLYKEIVKAEESENEASEEVIEEEHKELIKSEETMKILQLKHNLKIKNQVGEAINLESIDFNNPILKANLNGTWFGVGEQILDINISCLDEAADIINKSRDNNEKLEAELRFSWDRGSSTIYKPVVINVITRTEEIDEIIE